MHPAKSIFMNSLWILTIIFAVVANGADITSSVQSDAESIQSEIQNARKALDQVRKSKGKDTRDLDASIKSIRSGLSKLERLLMTSESEGSAYLINAQKTTGQLKEHSMTLQEARAASDWKAVDRVLGQMNSTIEKLISSSQLKSASNSLSRESLRAPVRAAGNPSKVESESGPNTNVKKLLQSRGNFQRE